MAPAILPQSDINNIRQVLVGLYEFQGDAHDRAAFLINAELKSFVGGIPLAGSAKIVTSQLLNRLNTHGYLVERPMYHALGVLFAYLLSTNDVGLEDKRYLANLVVEYGLVRDEAYLEQLRQQFDLTVPLPTTSEMHYPVKRETQKHFPKGPGFSAKIDDPVKLEKVLNSEDNFLDLHVLLGAIYSAKAVGRVELPEGKPQGTGFLIAPNLFLTNHHVLNNKDEIHEAVVRFGYVKDLLTVPLEGNAVRIDPEFYEFSPEDELDYALVKLISAPLTHEIDENKTAEKSTLALIRENKHRGYLLIAGRTIINTERVNIIQHPKGEPMKVVLTQNYVTATMSDRRVYYLADTDDGSSGSPVFNERWEVVALHRGSQETKIAAPRGETRVSYENVGIPMRAIIEDFRKKNLLKYLPEFRG